jgi:hypothetical protein
MERSQILVEERHDMQCRFGCKQPAIARFSTPQGCACFPNDRVQDLCGQHFLKAESIAGMYTICIFIPSVYDLLATR